MNWENCSYPIKGSILGGIICIIFSLVALIFGGLNSENPLFLPMEIIAFPFAPAGMVFTIIIKNELDISSESLTYVLFFTSLFIAYCIEGFIIGLIWSKVRAKPPSETNP